MRERDREQAGDGQREGGRRNPGRLCAVSTEPDAGLELPNSEIMNWAKTKSQDLTDWAIQVPQKFLIFIPQDNLSLVR